MLIAHLLKSRVGHSDILSIQFKPNEITAQFLSHNRSRARPHERIEDQRRTKPLPTSAIGPSRSDVHRFITRQRLTDSAITGFRIE